MERTCLALGEMQVETLRYILKQVREVTKTSIVVNMCLCVSHIAVRNSTYMNSHPKNMRSDMSSNAQFFHGSLQTSPLIPSFQSI